MLKEVRTPQAVLSFKNDFEAEDFIRQEMPEVRRDRNDLYLLKHIRQDDDMLTREAVFTLDYQLEQVGLLFDDAGERVEELLEYTDALS